LDRRGKNPINAAFEPVQKISGELRDSEMRESGNSKNKD
jgi:hypothetical protein